MDIPVTQLWDSRLLYIYALLGGYFESNSEDVHSALTAYINFEGNLNYCLEVLYKLDSEGRIKIGNLRTTKYKKSSLILSGGKKAERLVQPNKTEIKTDSIPHHNLSGLIAKLQREKEQKYVSLRLDSADSNWFKSMVSTYLKLYKDNKLFAPTGSLLTLYEQQKHEIESQIGSRRQKQIKGKQMGNSYRFLEALLTMSDEGSFKITALNPVHHIGTKEYRADVEQDFERVSKEPVAQKGPIDLKAEAKIDGTQIYVGIQGDELMPIWRMKTDSGTYHLMHYLQSHTEKDIGIGDIQLLDGCRSYKDLTEVIRNIGFNKHLKKVFFDGTSTKNIRFAPIRQLTPDLLKSFNKGMDSIRDKTVTNRN